MASLPREVVTLLQHGVTCRKDVKAVLGRARYETLIDGGVLEPRPGRLVAAPVLIDRWSPLVETQLRCRTAVACRRLACWLHQLPPFSGVTPPVQDWISTVRSQVAAVHLVRNLGPSEVTVVGGLRVTSPQRTLADLGIVDEALLERAAERMLHRRQVSEQALWAYVDAFPDRWGVQALRRFLHRRGQGAAPCESDLEVLGLQAIRRLGFPEPTHRQYPVPRDGGGLYRVDLVWAVGRRLVFVEIDGDGCHANPEALAYDLRRQNVLSRRRPVILRFCGADVRDFPAYIDREMSIHVPKLPMRRAC